MGSAHTADAQYTLVLSVAPPNVCTAQYWPPIDSNSTSGASKALAFIIGSAVGSLRIGQEEGAICWHGMSVL